MKIFAHTLRTGNGRVLGSSCDAAEDTRTAQRRGNSLATVMLVAIASLSSGCGNTLYLVQANRAERNFQEAVELGADVYAPYQYYSAKLRLEEARRQAAQAEYGAAADLSDEAYDYSVKAINICNAARSAEAKR